MRKTWIDRFNERWLGEPNSGCWLWLRNVSRDGYARISIGDNPHDAHRLSYEAHVGPIPAGLEIDHKCRTRSCVNPFHLEPVSHAENMRRSAPFRNQYRKDGRWAVRAKQS